MPTFPLTMPSNGIAQIEFGPIVSVSAFASPTTFQGETHVHSGQIWGGAARTKPLSRADAGEWRSFIASLNGMEGTFYIGDEGNLTPQGPMTGTPLVNGASQTGETLAIDGCTAGITWGKKGDYISLDSGTDTELYMLREDAVTNGSGEVTLQIWPDLVTSPANNEAVTVSNCRCVAKLVENSHPWPQGDDQFTVISFEFVEDR